jgi:hypothetical protein
MNLKGGLLAAAVITSAFAAPAFAHHSGAMFDRNKDVTLNGTLKEVEWVSPHAWLHLMVPGADGKPVEWSVEFGGGPATFPMMGITHSYPAVGDKIMVVAHPLRDGRPGGSFVSISLPDGRPLTAGRPGAAAPVAR